MRLLRLAGAVLALTFAAIPALAAGAQDGPGCLGVMVDECIRLLRTKLSLDEPFVADSMAQRHRTDVNGRPLSGGMVRFSASLPGQFDRFVILLHLRPDDAVQRVESSLLRSPLRAQTEQSYDKTGFYDIVAVVLGRRCPTLTKIELYRFFENSVKPRVTYEQKDYSTGINGLHRMYSRAVGIPYCGVNFGYTDALSWRGTKNAGAAPKLTETSVIELQ